MVDQCFDFIKRFMFTEINIPGCARQFCQLVSTDCKSSQFSTSFGECLISICNRNLTCCAGNHNYRASTWWGGNCTHHNCYCCLNLGHIMSWIISERLLKRQINVNKNHPWLILNTLLWNPMCSAGGDGPKRYMCICFGLFLLMNAIVSNI